MSEPNPIHADTQVVNLDKNPDNPDHMIELMERTLADQLGFWIRPSGNILGKYSCDLISDGIVTATSPADERQMTMWRMLVGQAAGYWAANQALEAVNDDRRELTDKVIQLGGKL